MLVTPKPQPYTALIDLNVIYVLTLGEQDCTLLSPVKPPCAYASGTKIFRVLLACCHSNLISVVLLSIVEQQYSGECWKSSWINHAYLTAKNYFNHQLAANRIE